MRELSSQIEFDATPDEVWEVLQDLARHAEWNPFITKIDGELHPGAALLRNELSVQGNIQLLMLLRRIFPGPAGARHPRELGRAALARRAPGRDAVATREAGR